METSKTKNIAIVRFPDDSYMFGDFVKHVWFNTAAMRVIGRCLDDRGLSFDCRYAANSVLYNGTFLDAELRPATAEEIANMEPREIKN